MSCLTILVLRLVPCSVNYTGRPQMFVNKCVRKIVFMDATCYDVTKQALQQDRHRKATKKGGQRAQRRERNARNTDNTAGRRSVESTIRHKVEKFSYMYVRPAYRRSRKLHLETYFRFYAHLFERERFQCVSVALLDMITRHLSRLRPQRELQAVSTERTSERSSSSGSERVLSAE